MLLDTTRSARGGLWELLFTCLLKNLYLCCGILGNRANTYSPTVGYQVNTPMLRVWCSMQAVKNGGFWSSKTAMSHPRFLQLSACCVDIHRSGAGCRGCRGGGDPCRSCLNSKTSLKFRGCWNTGIYTCVNPRVVFRNAKTRIHISMGIAADVLACGSLWTCSYRNAKFHFTVDPHDSKFAGIHASRILGDLR